MPFLIALPNVELRQQRHPNDQANHEFQEVRSSTLSEKPYLAELRSFSPK
jgi:hypothetical protein